MVASGIGALVLLVIASLSVYAMRSFAAMGNYTILDARNRTKSCKALLKMNDGGVSRGLYIAFSPLSRNTD